MMAEQLDNRLTIFHVLGKVLNPSCRLRQTRAGGGTIGVRKIERKPSAGRKYLKNLSCIIVNVVKIKVDEACLRIELVDALSSYRCQVARWNKDKLNVVRGRGSLCDSLEACAN